MLRLESCRGQIWTALVVIIVIIFGVVVGWSRLRAGSLPATEAAPSQAVATVNGVVIIQDMVDREVKISRLNVAEPLPLLNGDDLARAREEALNQLITRQLLLQEASRQGFRLEPEFIEKRADLLFGTYGDEALDAALAQAGATRDDLLWWVGEIFTVEEFTIQVIMADAAPEKRQQVYNEWLNKQQSGARIETLLDGETLTTSLALIGEPAPNFTLFGLDGEAISLSDYAGKVILVNFWATWCPSCITEMPDYELAYQNHKPDFVVIAINLQEGRDHVQQYADGLGLTFPVLLDQDGQVTSHRYQVTGMPGSFIVDRNGKIFYRHVGPMSEETLAAKLVELGL